MDVTFRRSGERRYAVDVERDPVRRSPDSSRRREAADMEPYVKRVRSLCAPEELEALAPPVVDRICGRLDEVSAAWRDLGIGGSMTLAWPGRRGKVRK